MKYLLLFFISFPAFADPILRFDAGEQSITLYDDKCSSKSVENLPFKVVLIEDGVAYEGCYGEVNWGPVILMFFEKKKVVGAMPTRVFKKVIGI